MVSRDSLAAVVTGTLVLGTVVFGTGCFPRPDTSVVLENDYPRDAAAAYVIYQAYWQAVSFDAAIVPGAASDVMPTVPASGNTAYVVVAPGWDPSSNTPPRSIVVLESAGQFAVNLDDTLTIPVSDETFIGNCAAGSALTQTEADFITNLVFPGRFAQLHYEAKDCTTPFTGDGGAE